MRTIWAAEPVAIVDSTARIPSVASRIASSFTAKWFFPSETRATTMPHGDAKPFTTTGETTMEYQGMDAVEALAFAERWLPAWSGNRPKLLASFYAEDVFYSDPANPEGIKGRDALEAYFMRLLAAYPDWVWTQRRSVPLPGGFLNYWHARIPAGGVVLEVDGVCTVELGPDGIRRNEVFFDRSVLFAGSSR